MRSNRRMRKAGILLLLALTVLYPSIESNAGFTPSLGRISAELPTSKGQPLPGRELADAKYAKESSAAAGFVRKRKHHKKRRRNSGMSWVALQKQFPGTFIFGGPRSERKVALTFDDVPDPRYTPQVMEILARYKVRATFFVVGSRAAAHPSLVRRMRREGHIIGNHSFNHAVFSRISLNSFKQQIVRTDAVLRPLAGYSPKLVRPPYGEITPRQIDWLRRNGYTVVNWDVDSDDWRSIDSSRILVNIKKTLQPGSIILQHAGGGKGQDLSGTVKALPRLIRLLRSKGYQIITLPELLDKPASRNSKR